MKYITVALCLALSACGLKPEEQVREVNVCKAAGLDYDITKTKDGPVMAVNCVKPLAKAP